MLTDTCTSCGIKLLGRGCTSFRCPACGEGIIGRCLNCRDQSARYTCPKCAFEGP